MASNRNSIEDNFHDFSDEASEPSTSVEQDVEVAERHNYPKLDLTDAHNPAWKFQFTDILQWIACLLVVWLLYVGILFVYNLVQRGRSKLPSGETIETLVDDALGPPKEWKLSDKLAKLNQASKVVIVEQKQKSSSLTEKIREFFHNLFQRPQRSPVEVQPHVNSIPQPTQPQKQEKDNQTPTKPSVYDIIERF